MLDGIPEMPSARGAHFFSLCARRAVFIPRGAEPGAPLWKGKVPNHAPTVTTGYIDTCSRLFHRSGPRDGFFSALRHTRKSLPRLFFLFFGPTHNFTITQARMCKYIQEVSKFLGNFPFG